MSKNKLARPPLNYITLSSLIPVVTFGGRAAETDDVFGTPLLSQPENLVT